MQASNANQPGRPDDPEWQFLVEYPLREFLPDHDKGGDLMAGLLSQTGRGWDIPIEYLENIDMTLTGFAKGALAHSNRGCIVCPGRIRIFCQKKLIDYAFLMNGGWGYFIIESSGDDAGSPGGTHPEIDLYLYKEGE